MDDDDFSRSSPECPHIAFADTFGVVWVENADPGVVEPDDVMLADVLRHHVDDRSEKLRRSRLPVSEG
jgi:hypothetical protein